MRNYEVTFIVDPVQDGADIKATAQKYVDHLQNAGCKIVHVNELGLRELAYQINRRTSGVYYCIEFEATNGAVIAPMELQMRRDGAILRFLSVQLDKYGVKYNQDKRDGKIGVAKKPVKKQKQAPQNRNNRNKKKKGGNHRNQNQNQNQSQQQKPAPKPAPEKAAPKPVAEKAVPTPPPAPVAPAKGASEEE